MKKHFISILFISIFNSLNAQTDTDIINNINHLLDSSTDSQEEISFLFSVINEDTSKLIPHKKLLNKNLNDILKKPYFNFSIVHLSLELASNDLLEIDNESENQLVQQNLEFRSQLKQEKGYHQWIWDDESYIETRNNSSLVLDLLGFCKGSVSLKELKASLSSYIDTRPKFFAAISLLRRKEEISNKDILEIAKEDETRGVLYKYLKELDKLALFPKEYLTQETLSRADMVNWLIYPTELARVPTKIELVKIFTIEYEDVGPADFYLWKFMSDHQDWKEDGYMAGLSGPFVRSQSPTMDAYGYTFSSFTKFNEKSPEEHFDEIIEILDKWNNQNNN